MTPDGAGRTVSVVSDDTRPSLASALERGGALEDVGGDEACWMDRVCPECGLFVGERGAECPRCGHTLP